MSVPATRRAFSLIELVIVVVIIGIIAAIAIPRMSRGAAGAADGALTANLAVLRNAIELFHAEHGKFPDADKIEDQLKGYTNLNGDIGTLGDGTSIYGPYIREIPPLPVGAKKGSKGIAAADGAGVGWIYTAATGQIRANTTASEKDVNGKLYSDY